MLFFQICALPTHVEMVQYVIPCRSKTITPVRAPLVLQEPTVRSLIFQVSYLRPFTFRRAKKKHSITQAQSTQTIVCAK